MSSANMIKHHLDLEFFLRLGHTIMWTESKTIQLTHSPCFIRFTLILNAGGQFIWLTDLFIWSQHFSQSGAWNFWEFQVLMSPIGRDTNLPWDREWGGRGGTGPLPQCPGLQDARERVFDSILKVCFEKISLLEQWAVVSQFASYLEADPFEKWSPVVRTNLSPLDP